MDYKIPGLGVMIGQLQGNKDSVDAFMRGKDKEIADLGIDDNALTFIFVDGYQMKLFDGGQTCCENRFMHTDDDLSFFIGSKLTEAETRPGPEKNVEYGDVEESEFLIVTTTKGQFTIVNYNEHNGYYGGFLIRAAAIKMQDDD